MTLSPHLRHALSPLVPFLTTVALTGPCAGLLLGTAFLLALVWTVRG